MYSDLFSFYRSKEWETLRSRITLERVNASGDLICEHCGKPIVHPYDAICHHKIELTESNVHDATIALNPDNIMVVHHRCHNMIHERFGYNSGTRHIYVVWGSPCAGKRAFVDANAGKNDIIVDIDRIYECINLSRSGMVKGNVFQIYRMLIDAIRTRNGKWRNAWVVRGLPLRIDRENIIKDLGGGEMIHINTDFEECLKEARRRGGSWEEWLLEYQAKYQPDE